MKILCVEPYCVLSNASNVRYTVFHTQQTELDRVTKTSDDAVYRTCGDRTGGVCHAAAAKLAVGLGSVFTWTVCV